MTEDQIISALSSFLDALEEWGLEDNVSKAKHILDFQRCGYDLSEYMEVSEDGYEWGTIN